MQNERQITYYTEGGHTHNGINSSPVENPPKSIHMEMLGDDVMNFILSMVGGPSDNGGPAPVADLEFEVTLPAETYNIGAIAWVSQALVRYTRIVMSVDTECKLTFFHTASYQDEDREFRAEHCSNYFLWEGPWIHHNDNDLAVINYKIENTGSAAATFKVIIKACGVA